MVQKLIVWAVHNPLVVLLLSIIVVGFGAYAFLNVNVEAYPDPAPAIIEVIAQYPGASAEEVERLVTIPLEVALAGMPGLRTTRSKSLLGLSYLNNQFEYGVDYFAARQEVLNRLQAVDLPEGVVPELSGRTPLGEMFRYVVVGPKDEDGRDIYTLSDLQSLQEWVLVREFRRIPRIEDVVSFGGTSKRYEIHPDPDRLARYGISLQQLADAIEGSNINVGGDFLIQGQTVQAVRGIGLIGGGQDPVQQVLGLDDPRAAAAFLRSEEQRRLREIRRIVVATINNVPIRVEDLVDGGPLLSEHELSERGVVVGHHTRLGRVSVSRPLTDSLGIELRDEDGRRIWVNDADMIQGLILLRKDEYSLPALQDVKNKVRELNEQPGWLLPGVRIVPTYDRSGLVHMTTETVRENLFLGMVLVVVILLMFLGNVPSALIAAINIPIALLFAYAMLFMRGKSANLLSIGALDFGIIVDASVIMVENIHRHLSTGEHSELPLKDRIIRASHEVERSLFFSTAIMVCAFIPLFTMQGPEGQIFGPMADTYAFALGGALLAAVTLTPVLCLYFFKRVTPSRDNWLVRNLKAGYLKRLEFCLNHRWLTLAVFGLFVAFSLIYTLPRLGREFMPELHEGTQWVRGIFPVNVALDEVVEKTQLAQAIIGQFPEVELISAQLGRPDDGTDPVGFYSAEILVPLKPRSAWPAVKLRTGWQAAVLGEQRPRTLNELIEDMNAELSRYILGVNWDFSQPIRDNVMEVLSGVQGENSVKIFGPDLDELEHLGEQVKEILDRVPGVENAGLYRIKGQPNLEFPIDRDKTALWNVSVLDVANVIETAVAGKAFTQMIEGEKTFDVTLRWPERLRRTEDLILDIPVEVTGHVVAPGGAFELSATPFTGAVTALPPYGTRLPMPALTGTGAHMTMLDLDVVPRRRLRDFVTPLGADGRPDPDGSFVRPGASMIYREQGLRMVVVKFGVRGRDLASTVAEAQRRVAPLLSGPYRAVWSGEFREMEQAERRLMYIVPMSLGLIFALLYLAFRSLMLALMVFSNVAAVLLGGLWALVLTGTNFSVSAAVGFISIFGVAIMDGLLLVSYFRHLQARGFPLREAIMQGAEKRIRPVMMTALAAIFGLLPAAVSTRIGAQTQQPLAIVVVGGALLTLILTRYMMPVLYSLYGRHDIPPDEVSDLVH